MVRFVHGDEQLKKVQLISNFLFSKPFHITNLSDEISDILCTNNRFLNCNESTLLSDFIQDNKLIQNYGKLNEILVLRLI